MAGEKEATRLEEPVVAAVDAVAGTGAGLVVVVVVAADAVVRLLLLVVVVHVLVSWAGVVVKRGCS